MKTTLHIEGMSCEHCRSHVSEALQETAGVSSVSVSLENKSAEVEHSEGVSIDALKAAVREAGYEA